MRMYSPYLLVLALLTPIAWSESLLYDCRDRANDTWRLLIYPDRLLKEKTGETNVDACAVEIWLNGRWSCHHLHAYKKGDYIKFSKLTTEEELQSPGHFYDLFLVQELEWLQFVSWKDETSLHAEKLRCKQISKRL